MKPTRIWWTTIRILPLAPTAQLQIATLYRQAAADGDRNHVNVARAQEAYEDYLQRYPNTAKAGAARADLAAMKRELIAQQLEVAEYYLTKMKDTNAGHLLLPGSSFQGGSQSRRRRQGEGAA